MTSLTGTHYSGMKGLTGSYSGRTGLIGSYSGMTGLTDTQG